MSFRSMLMTKIFKFLLIFFIVLILNVNEFLSTLTSFCTKRFICIYNQMSFDESIFLHFNYQFSYVLRI